MSRVTVWVGLACLAVPAVLARATDAGVPQPSKQLVVDARLVDRGRRAPPCGGGHFVVVMRFEVVRVVEGAYDEKDLYVAVSCPEMSMPHRRGADGKDESVPFVVGGVYHLQLRKGAGPGALVDAFAASKLPRYLLRRADLVPPAAP